MDWAANATSSYEEPEPKEDNTYSYGRYDTSADNDKNSSGSYAYGTYDNTYNKQSQNNSSASAAYSFGAGDGGMHDFFNKYANNSGSGSKGTAIYGSPDLVVSSNTKSKEVSPAKDEYTGSYNYSSNSNNYTSKYDSEDYVPAYTFESKK